jgi:multidrug efflux pump subunit AcrB
MLSSRWLRLDMRPDSEQRKNVLQRIVDVFYRPIERAYMAVLGWVVHPWRRWIVVALCLVALIAIVPLAKSIPGGFLPKNDEAQFQIDVRTTEGTSAPGSRLARGDVDGGDDRRQLPEDAQRRLGLRAVAAP